MSKNVNHTGNSTTRASKGKGENDSVDSGLEHWGWSPHWDDQLSLFLEESTALRTEALQPRSSVEPGRVIFHSHELYRVQTAGGTQRARIAGRLRHQEASLPAVGDWVVLTNSSTVEGAGESLLVGTLPRRTRLSRKVAGDRTQEQVVAANIDTVFLVMGLDGDFNPARLERFVVMAAESGAASAVILTKADLVEDPEELKWRASDAAPGLPVYAVSAPIGLGLEPLSFYLEPGKTVALVGSSGVGKSTLINHLSGQVVMKTGAVREDDDRGRHTTTHRELIQLKQGGLLIDNPGIREIQLWTDGTASLEESFADIEALATECRFRDCAHESEPDCAIQQALEDGRLAAKRLANYKSLEKELRFLELRQDAATRRKKERKLGLFYKRTQAQKKKNR